MAERKIFAGLFFPLWNAESLFLFFIIFLICFSPFVLATDRYVYPPQSSSRPALSFAGVVVQYPHIQAAIDDACDGDIIYLAPGRFTGFGNRDLDFQGKAITISGLDPNDPNIVAATIIDCNGTETDKHRGFYFHSGEDNNSVLCGLTVTNGYQDYGGGMFCQQSSPYIYHCNFISNSARIYGSAIGFDRISTVFSDCVIADNKYSSAVSTTSGSRDASNLLIKNCIVKNTFLSSSPNYYYVGGINCGGGTTEIINCRIERNESFGVMGNYGVIKISNCQIIGNGIIGGSRPHGGVYGVERGRITIGNSAILVNVGFGIRGCEEVNNCFVSYNSGNGIESSQRIISSKIIGNGSDGIYRFIGYYGVPKVINCVIAKNKGRGIYYSGSAQNLSNCTIVDNGGVGVELYNPTINITNCIIRDNFDEQIRGVTSTTKITYTNSYRIYDLSKLPEPILYPGTGNINSDPCFVSDLDFHLMPNSPCIDAGTNDPNFVTEPNDIEGSPRILDGDGDGIAVADIGAYEYNGQQPVIAAWAERIVYFKNTDQQPQNRIYIKNAGGGVLNYEIESDCNWLSVIPSQGISDGRVQEVNVIVDTNKVELGDYFCRIKIYDPNAPNSPLDSWLQVHIGSLLIVPTDFNTIQAAIDAANDFDHIYVLDGTYTGPGNTDVDFAGKDVVLRSIGGDENCIIDCQQTANGFKFISGETSEAVLDGFSIINASQQAVYCDACSSPSITNCIIADSRQSGVYMQNYCSPSIANCKFKDCSYGGIYCFHHCNINVKGCEFVDCGSPGILADNCEKVSIKDCNITSYGKGVFCFVATEVSIENCLIHDCMGGGVELMEVGEFQMNGTYIRNCGWYYGVQLGGIRLEGGWQGKISNCILTGNGLRRPNFPFSGGGIYDGRANIIVQNCLLSGNNIGCIVRDSQVRFENCTFTGNYSYQAGSTLWCYGNPEVNFVNCILWDEGNLVYKYNGSVPIIDISYSGVRGGWEGIGNIDEDPCFVERGYWDPNSTPGDANDDFWVDGDYHLKSFGWRWDQQEQDWVFDRRTSRCIDAGNPGYPLGDEPLTVPPDPDNIWGENLRIDMGMYGGTAEASIPPYDWALLSDMDNSGEVDFVDYSYQADYYGREGEKLSGDLNRDGKVDLADIDLIAADWLEHTDWAMH